jgi:ABC-type transport system involved in cytochrome c biogenesis permease subunit
MLAGVSTICYAVALVLEIARPLFRGRVRAILSLGFTAAGLTAHTAFLYYRAIHAAGAPLSSERDWFFVAAWALVAVYCYLAVLQPKVPFGVFLLPLALALVATARLAASPEPLTHDPASRAWGAIHGVAIMMATVSVLVGFVAGLMYLGQARRLKYKRLPNAELPLPSLEWLRWANRRAIQMSLLMMGVGVLAGMVLNLVNIRSGVDRVPWNDPVIISTWGMFLWLLLTVVLTAVYRPARAGRQVAYFTLASFVFLAIMLAVGLSMNSRHWSRGWSDAPRQSNRAVDGGLPC